MTASRTTVPEQVDYLTTTLREFVQRFALDLNHDLALNS